MARKPKKMSRSDYDSPWKDILTRFLPEFFLLFFPDAYERIDWKKKPVFLDKELAKIVREGKVGKRYADKLVRVTTLEGEVRIVFVHIEVQGKRQDDFDHRMFVYNYRIHDRYGGRVASFAVLTDQDGSWRPGDYRSEALGTEVRLIYGAAKLVDLDPEALEGDPNPMALVARAHQASLETARERTPRLEAKLELIRAMCRRGYNQETYDKVFRFVDWVMDLPDDLVTRFADEAKKIERKSKMKYVTSTEKYFTRKGIEKGREQERSELLLRIVRKRFGARVGSKTKGLLGGVDDLNAAIDLAIDAEDGKAFVKALQRLAGGE